MTERDHLDPATIAALVDRTLDPAARAAAEAHLSRCADCREVWVETSEMAEAMRGTTTTDAANAPARVVAPRPRSRWWIYGGAGLAAAATIALAVFSPRLFDRGDRPELRALVEAVGENRRTEARLTGGFKWGPVPSITRGAGTSADADVQLAVAQIVQRRTKTNDAHMIAAAGIGALVQGELDSAISELELAVKLAPDDAASWSNLAAAYLEWHRQSGERSRATEALRATERALAIEPRLAEAVFNRGLALTSLGRTDEARRAWAEYLLLDSSSRWAEEARHRSRTLAD